MPTWIDTVDIEVLKVALQHTSAQHLISMPDGKILWANKAFIKWVGYTLSELTHMTWMDFSVYDDQLKVDLEEVAKLEGYQISYTVQKKYVPRDRKPEHGLLHVLRYPLNGPIECCICTWEPLREGNVESLEVAIQYFKVIDEKLLLITRQTEEEKLVIGILQLIRKYPKVALAILFGLLSIFGINNALQILQGMGYIPEPTRQVEIKGQTP
jgi:hypothetical protein